MSNLSRTYHDELKRTVKLMRRGWHTAGELETHLGVAHQTVYNRMEKLKALGFTIEQREGAFRGTRKWKITAGSEGLLE